MDNPEQLIRSGIDRQKLAEMVVRGLLGGTAYLVNSVALLLFGGIVKKGAPVLFKAEAPFVDFAFLTSKTETLHVFDDPTGKRREMPAGEFYRYVAEHGEAAAANEQTFSYSGGGIAGPIVGTALLTGTSIILALFFGVSAPIYLSEYSRQGRFISIVRLAILNLAGVPSIVFGLFGFSVFVLAVPVITGNPSERSLLDIPLFGSGLHLSFQGWNSSLIAGAATLACMILPVIITASEE